MYSLSRRIIAATFALPCLLLSNATPAEVPQDEIVISNLSAYSETSSYDRA